MRVPLLRLKSALKNALIQMRVLRLGAGRRHRSTSGSPQRRVRAKSAESLVTADSFAFSDSASDPPAARATWRYSVAASAGLVDAIASARSTSSSREADALDAMLDLHSARWGARGGGNYCFQAW